MRGRREALITLCQGPSRGDNSSMKYHGEMKSFPGISSCVLSSQFRNGWMRRVLNWVAALCPARWKESYLCLRSWRSSLDFNPLRWAMGMGLVSLNFCLTLLFPHLSPWVLFASNNTCFILLDDFWRWKACTLWNELFYTFSLFVCLGEHFKILSVITVSGRDSSLTNLKSTSFSLHWYFTLVFLPLMCFFFKTAAQVSLPLAL